jgi:nucleoside-diphosphate-sugar epimerase
MTRVLVTGATGFVGRTLCEVLSKAGHTVRAALRTDRSLPGCVSERAIVGDIGGGTDWGAALLGVDMVVHLAARAHVIHDALANSTLYFETNAQGTRSLAEASAKAGVRRFVYLSSVKVNGESTPNRPYTAIDVPCPQDDYGRSKWAAEKHLTQIAADTGMRAVIVRSPLVYGPGVRANFLRLMAIVDKGWPLPLEAIENQRSLVNIWNLCDFMAHVLGHPAAPDRVWMVSDGDDLSTPELIRRIGRAMGRRTKLFAVPVNLLNLTGRLVGKKEEVERLCGSLVLDVTPARRELGWSPSTTIDEALARTVQWYVSKT